LKEEPEKVMEENGGEQQKKGVGGILGIILGG
jgi:hypothetical protein